MKTINRSPFSFRCYLIWKSSDSQVHLLHQQTLSSDQNHQNRTAFDAKFKRIELSESANPKIKDAGRPLNLIRQKLASIRKNNRNSICRTIINFIFRYLQLEGKIYKFIGLEGLIATINWREQHTDSPTGKALFVRPTSLCWMIWVWISTGYYPLDRAVYAMPRQRNLADCKASDYLWHFNFHLFFHQTF